MVINGSGDLGTLYFDPSSDGITNALNNVTVNRTSSGTVTLGNKLNLTGTYIPTAGILNSNGYLTLKSSAAGTASVSAGAADCYSPAICVVITGCSVGNDGQYR